MHAHTYDTRAREREAQRSKAKQSKARVREGAPGVGRQLRKYQGRSLSFFNHRIEGETTDDKTPVSQAQKHDMRRATKSCQAWGCSQVGFPETGGVGVHRVKTG